MGFDFEIAENRLALAERYISDVQKCIEEEDYASVKYCAYYTFFFSMEALLLGHGEDTFRHSVTLERFKQLYMDTDILPVEEIYPTLQLGLRIHNEEAYEDVSICSDDKALSMMNLAKWFHGCISRYINKMKRLPESDRAKDMVRFVRQIIDLADEWRAFEESEDESFLVFNNDYDLYEQARNNLKYMLRQGFGVFEGLLETYADCCLKIIYWLDRHKDSSIQNKKEVLSICLKLAESDPDKWGRPAADICEAVADSKIGPEADRLYREALELYEYLYSVSNDEWDLECIENLRFKLDAD